MNEIPENIIYDPGISQPPWRVYRDLTIGKMYKVQEYDLFGHRYVIKDDIGEIIHVLPDYFKSLDFIRNEKINILI
jgi:hypothetical protein